MLNKLTMYIGKAYAERRTHNAAINLARKLYLEKDTVEHLYILDMEGEVQFYSVGDENEVYAPQELAEYANENDYVSIHNHPSTFAVPSKGDLISALLGWETAGYIVDNYGIVCRYAPNWDVIREAGLTPQQCIALIDDAYDIANDLFVESMLMSEEKAVAEYGVWCYYSSAWLYWTLVEYFNKYPIFDISIITAV